LGACWFGALLASSLGVCVMMLRLSAAAYAGVWYGGDALFWDSVYQTLVSYDICHVICYPIPQPLTFLDRTHWYKTESRFLSFRPNTSDLQRRLSQVPFLLYLQ
jgi:hypothetical protein